MNYMLTVPKIDRIVSSVTARIATGFSGDRVTILTQSPKRWVCLWVRFSTVVEAPCCSTGGLRRVAFPTRCHGVSNRPVAGIRRLGPACATRTPALKAALPYEPVPAHAGYSTVNLSR